MDLELKGKKALITGGSRGLGRAAALALAGEGCDIAIVARTQETLDQTAAELRETGVRVMPIKADVTDPDDIRRMVAEGSAGLGAARHGLARLGKARVLNYEQITLGRRTIVPDQSRRVA